MRAVAAIPAVALIAGSALGLLAPDIPRFAPLAILTGCAAGAMVAWRAQRTIAFAICVGAVFLAGGDLLAADAWHEA